MTDSKVWGWIDKGLQIQQSIRAEQTTQAMSEQTKMIAKQDERGNRLQEMLAAVQSQQTVVQRQAQRQMYLRQMIFELRECAEIVQAIPPLMRCYHCLEMGDVCKELDLSWIDQINDKQWHVDTIRMFEKTFLETATKLGEGAPDAMKQLFQTLSEIQKFVDFSVNLAEMRDKKVGEPLSEKLIEDWTISIRLLHEAVQLAEKSAESIPGEPLEHWPQGEIVSKAKKGILAKAGNDRFAFKCIVLAAKAKGEIGRAEHHRLSVIGNRYAMPADVVQWLIRDAKSISKSEFLGDRVAAEILLRDLYSNTALDGPVSSLEQNMIEKVGLNIGLPSEVVAGIIAAGSDEARLNNLDCAATQKAFLSGPESAKKKSYIGNNVPPELMAYFRKWVSIPEGHIPVISAEWKTLGIARKSAVLLTNGGTVFLILEKSGNMQIPNVFKIRVGDIVSFNHDFGFGYLGLKSGDVVTTSRAMNDFMEAFFQAISDGRRTH